MSFHMPFYMLSPTRVVSLGGVFYMLSPTLFMNMVSCASAFYILSPTLPTHMASKRQLFHFSQPSGPTCTCPALVLHAPGPPKNNPNSPVTGQSPD